MSSESPEKSDQEPEEMESLAASEAADVVDTLNKNRSRIFVGISRRCCQSYAVLVSTKKKQKHLEAAAAQALRRTPGEAAARWCRGLSCVYPCR